MQPEVAVEMRNISKNFGAIKANEDVNFTVKYGEVHALLGENGAGKSTLMNMLSGIYNPDSGSVFVHGKEVHFSSPKEPIQMGIGMIHQHFKLVDIFTARENIILGKKGKLFVNKEKINQEIESISDKYGLGIQCDKKVYDMSVGEKQTLEIIKVLYRGADILILDEPTAVLTPQEIKKLFTIINNMKAAGCAIIIITHKLNEVMEISDRVTVLRKGKSITTLDTKTSTIQELTEKMVGKSIDLSITKPEVLKKEKLLSVKKLTVKNNEDIYALKDISFSLKSGEILGVAGIAGSGQKELCETIAGLCKAENGEIFFEGDNILGKSPKDIIRLGIRMGFIPEDRLGMGLVASMDIVHNLILKDYQTQDGVFLKRKHIADKAEKIVQRLDINTPSIHHPVRKLSGGNIQKVLLGREIDSDPKVLITAYPVRGLDIGASFRIYDLLNEQKNRGVGILFIGEDLDVLIELCDRILVLCDGELTGVVKTEDITKEEIGLLMAGESILEQGGKSHAENNKTR